MDIKLSGMRRTNKGDVVVDLLVSDSVECVKFRVCMRRRVGRLRILLTHIAWFSAHGSGRQRELAREFLERVLCAARRKTCTGG